MFNVPGEKRQIYQILKSRNIGIAFGLKHPLSVGLSYS